MQGDGSRRLGLFSGVGLVIADMIGTGVFVSAGFMAQDLGPGWILLSWGAGLLLALAGAKAYAAVALQVPRSGGEYRYLSDLLHPALGYLAGWASLLVGFSLPVAVAALAAAGYLGKLIPGPAPVVLAIGFILMFVVLHGFQLSLSVRAQNSLFVLKLVLVVGFALLGLLGGNWDWPTWQPPNAQPGLPLDSLLMNQFYIAFAFAGWNAAVYAASEFREPKRDIPRAMLIGCAAVGVVYLVLNWVFVANLTPDQAIVVAQEETQRITLGHLIAENLMGSTGAAFFSGFMVIAFLSSISTLMFIGPRVYASMAEDGFLPKALAAREGKPPVGSVVFQGLVAITIVSFTQLGDILKNTGAILTLFSALTVLSLFWVLIRKDRPEKPSLGSLLAAAVYSLLAGWMLYAGFKSSWQLLLWIGAVALVALAAFFLTRFFRPSDR